MMKRLHLEKTWQISEAYVGMVAAESKLDSQHDFVVDHQSAVEFYSYLMLVNRCKFLCVLVGNIRACMGMSRP